MRKCSIKTPGIAVVFVALLSPLLWSLDDFSSEAGWQREVNGLSQLWGAADFIGDSSGPEAAMGFSREERLASSGLYIHLVSATDTLETIRQLYRVDLDEVCQINGIRRDAKIPAGFQLMIP